MIAQARITSDTSATVHLAAETVDLEGSDLPEIRARVKQAFITAARDADEAVDVVIVEPDVRHHLRVEPSGRISGRTPDDRPLYGPAIDAPLVAPPAGTEAEPLSMDDTADLSEIEAEALGLHAAPSGTSASGPSATTGEQAVIGSPVTGELPTVRPSRARRRRAAAMPPSSVSDALLTEPSEHPVSPATTPVSEAGASTVPVSAGSAGSAGSEDASAWAPATSDDVPQSPAPSPAEGPTHSAGSPPAGGTARAAAPPAPAPRAAAPAVLDPSRPTLHDLQISTAKPVKDRATRGWQGLLTTLTGGIISPRPGKAERSDNERLERIRRPLEGPRNVAVVNLKGGAHKTTASLMIAATLGVTRGGNVLAWDNNETRGTLGWRGIPTEHRRTAVDLLHGIDRLRAPAASSAELDPYVRPQGGMRFDILASDEDPGSAASIDAEAFGELNDVLSRFYRIKVIDTGNNVRASNWLAAVRNADQLVIISTVREDTFNAAAWMIDELRATGLAEQVDHAVTILSHSSKGRFDPVLRKRLVAHFGSHTRAVTEVPYEQQFVDGSHLDWSRVSPATKEAWMDATALIVDGL